MRAFLAGFIFEPRACAQICWVEPWRITFRDTRCVRQATSEKMRKIRLREPGSWRMPGAAIPCERRVCRGGSTSPVTRARQHSTFFRELIQQKRQPQKSAAIKPHACEDVTGDRHLRSDNHGLKARCERMWRSDTRAFGSASTSRCTGSNPGEAERHPQTLEAP
jgi:hypothetical protein